MQHQEKKFVSGDQQDIKLEKTDTPEQGESLADDALKQLCDWLRESLGKDRVVDVSAGDRLVESPAIALNTDAFMTTNMRRIMKAMSQQKGEAGDHTPNPVNLQINPRHGLIKNLASLKDSSPETAKLIAEQIYDNALISAGLLEDPRTMIKRLHSLMEKIPAK